MVDTAADAPLSSPGQGSPAVVLGELVQRAAARLLRRELPPGQDSVSVALKLAHVAHIGSPYTSWWVTVRRVRVRGRLHEFAIDVADDSGSIASATHTRAVVIGQRFVAQARRRAGLPSMLLNV